MKHGRNSFYSILITLICAGYLLVLSGCQSVGQINSPLSADNNRQFLYIEEIVIGLFCLAILVGIITNRFRLPYTVGLVLIGLMLTLAVKTEIEFPPTLILALLVPPLIFEAGFHINFADLRANFRPIVLLAVPGVLFVTCAVGWIVSFGAGISLSAALILGALVSATDPVSVVALFRTVSAPKRLRVILEAESLFNDGTAIVVFSLVTMLASVQERISIPGVILEFIIAAGGGIAIGLILGYLVSQLIGRIDEYLIETALTTVLAYGAYLIAEHFGVSGVLAVASAGLMCGNIGPRGMSPTTRIVLFNFWEVVAFLVNSFIFLLIGLQIHLDLLFQHWVLILWAIFAVLISRAVMVYLTGGLVRNIPLKWQHLLFWGGLRGAITLALALSLPDSLGAAKPEIQVMAFGVVVFTLIVSGFSMNPLVRRLGVVERSEQQAEYERRQARAVISRMAYDHLRKSHHQGWISEHTWNLLAPLLEARNKSLVEGVREVMIGAPEVEALELDLARREFLRAQRTALTDLLQGGIISDESFDYLTQEVDAGLSSSSFNWYDRMGQTAEGLNSIDCLVAAVIQETDQENAANALTKLGMSITQLPSTGGFLTTRNATMLIGLRHGQEEMLVNALDKSCRKRVVYLSTPVPEWGVASPPIPVSVGGATIFTFEVERFEVF
jgi:monovalent cation:H+ antiporter, CPA1 family